MTTAAAWPLAERAMVAAGVVLTEAELRELERRANRLTIWKLAELPEEERAEILDGMPLEALQALDKDWEFHARDDQLIPLGAWHTWLILAGRGWGKTRVGAEGIRELVAGASSSRIALVAPTSADCRDVMIEGESGLLKIFPEHERPNYQPSKRKITFHNGAVGYLYSAEEPERLRGPQHHFAWLDEIGVYGENLKPLWNNLRFGLRLGEYPRVIATTTPRPLKFLKELIADPGTRTTRGSTFDNSAALPEAMLTELKRLYSGTTIGRQELNGELLEDAEGALWKRATIDKLRRDKPAELIRVVIAIDPSVTAGDNSDACGIIAAGLGEDGHGYILADRSGVLPVNEWAHRAVSLYDQLEADKIIAEVNNGGDLVESVIRTVRRDIPYEKVTASRGKTARAEPVAALYEQGKVHHTREFTELEEEMCNFVPGALTKSPNRADAMVWAITQLMGGKGREARVW